MWFGSIFEVDISVLVVGLLHGCIWGISQTVCVELKRCWKGKSSWKRIRSLPHLIVAVHKRLGFRHSSCLELHYEVSWCSLDFALLLHIVHKKGVG